MVDNLKTPQLFFRRICSSFKSNNKAHVLIFIVHFYIFKTITNFKNIWNINFILGNLSRKNVLIIN
jgi:hypothetical protein